MNIWNKLLGAVCPASGVACLALILSSCEGEGPVDPSQNPGNFNRTMQSGGLDRVYDVHVNGPTQKLKLFWVSLALAVIAERLVQRKNPQTEAHAIPREAGT